MKEKIICKITNISNGEFGTIEAWNIFKDGKEVGFASVQNWETKEEDGVYVERIDVYDGFRGKGYGTALLEAIDEYYDYDIYICPDNERAAKLYERLGEKLEYYPEPYCYLDCGLGVYDITHCSW